MFILDSHCDTPSQIMRLRDLSKDNSGAHVDFPKLRRGGVSSVFFALYTSGTMTPDSATRYALEMLSGVYDQVEACPDKVALAFTSEDITRIAASGRTAVCIGMENGLPIQRSLPLLRMFYRTGVRYLTLTHNTDNDICDSASGGRRWGGLSPFGREGVAEMNRLGMIVDLAHASDETFYDCVRLSKAPVVSTHSCCRALAGHRRNMSDDMLRALASTGGVIQINFYPVFLSDSFAHLLDKSGLDTKADEIEEKFIKDPSDEGKRLEWSRILKELSRLPRPSVEDVVDHIDHAVKVAGIDHVGVGSDFDGINVTPSGLDDISMIGNVFDCMARRGYSDSEIAKVAGENFLRVMKTAESIADKSNLLTIKRL